MYAERPLPRWSSINVPKVFFETTGRLSSTLFQLCTRRSESFLTVRSAMAARSFKNVTLTTAGAADTLGAYISFAVYNVAFGIRPSRVFVATNINNNNRRSRVEARFEVTYDDFSGPRFNFRDRPFGPGRARTTAYSLRAKTRKTASTARRTFFRNNNAVFFNPSFSVVRSVRNRSP